MLLIFYLINDANSVEGGGGGGISFNNTSSENPFCRLLRLGWFSHGRGEKSSCQPLVRGLRAEKLPFAFRLFPSRRRNEHSDGI
jgi:hypothetical protein